MSHIDLYGKPLTPQPEFQLNKWQKRQAALLYHFASLDYLKGLKKLLDDFVNGVDITLDLAQQQGRDQLLVSERWGVRDTVANFSTYGFPALKDFQKATNRDIARRASELYEFTGYNQCARLLGELSMNWSTPEEEQKFEAGMKRIANHAGPVDSTMKRSWDDGVFAIAARKFEELLDPLPKFRVRTDVTAESGKRPIRTGVYVPQDDAYGSLQFGWTGNSDGCLADCQTFNELGLQAVNAVGRDALWSDDARLLPIVKQAKYLAAFKELDWFKDPNFLNDPTPATYFLGHKGIAYRPCKWYFVERVEDEYEDDAPEGLAQAQPEQLRGRCVAGQPCSREGFWFTPAQTNSRRFFKAGEVMPELGGDYGTTIWQWDPTQAP